MKDKNKQADLHQLEKVLRFPYIHRTSFDRVVQSLWHRYPLQFVTLMRQYRTIKEDPSTGDVADEAYPCALNLVNVLYCKLQGYLRQLPQTPAQQEDFRDVWNKLEDLLLRQNVEN